MLLFPFSNASAALTHDPSLTWNTLHSRHFAVHYHDGEEALARETAAIAEKVHARLSKLFNWTPREPTDVILTDQTDFSNGFASPVPSNRMTLFVAVPDDLTLADHGDWLELLITHEYTHILHLDKATGGPAVMRKIFGRLPLPFPLAFPNAFQPAWLIEGLATYTETDTQRDIGRGQSSFFDMFMRMEVDHGVKPLRQINQPIATWPGGTAPYLYGVQFYNFIAETKGEEKIMGMVDNYSDDWLPFFINRNSKKVFGKNLSQLWDEFEAYLKQKYNPQGLIACGCWTPQGKLLETPWTGPAGEVIAGLDWSPDGASLVASRWRRAGGWNLERFFFDHRNWKTRMWMAFWRRCARRTAVWLVEESIG